MQTFEQLVYSCLNEGVINPSDYVDLEGIMNLLKPMCVPEYWNDFLILKPEYSKYTKDDASNPFAKFELTSINILNTKIPIKLFLMSYRYYYWVYRNEKRLRSGYWSKNGEIILYLPVMYYRPGEWDDSEMDSNEQTKQFTTKEYEAKFAEDLIKKNKLKKLLKYLFNPLKIKNIIGHEIVHGIEEIKQILKGYKRDEKEIKSSFDTKDFEGYLTGRIKSLGKIPSEFNTILWELINLAKNGTTPKEKYLEYLKSGGNVNLMPKEWTGIETKEVRYSQFLQAISKKSPRLKKILFSKLAQQIQKL